MMVAGPVWRMLAGSPGFFTRYWLWRVRFTARGQVRSARSEISRAAMSARCSGRASAQSAGGNVPSLRHRRPSRSDSTRYLRRENCWSRTLPDPSAGPRARGHRDHLRLVPPRGHAGGRARHLARRLTQDEAGTYHPLTHCCCGWRVPRHHDGGSSSQVGIVRRLDRERFMISGWAAMRSCDVAGRVSPIAPFDPYGSVVWPMSPTALASYLRRGPHDPVSYTHLTLPTK